MKSKQIAILGIIALVLIPIIAQGVTVPLNRPSVGLEHLLFPTDRFVIVGSSPQNGYGLTVATSTYVSNILAVNGQLQGSSGSVGTPGISFADDPNTGIYNTADALLISAGGSNVAQFDSSGLTLGGSEILDFAVGSFTTNGSFTSPNLRRSTDTNTGIFWDATTYADQLLFTTGGTMTMILNNASSTLGSDLNIEGYTFMRGGLGVGVLNTLAGGIFFNRAGNDPFFVWEEDENLIGQIRADQTRGAIYFSSTNGQTTYFQVNTSGGSAGNVGIGDTSPAYMLTVGNGELFTVSSTGNATTTGHLALPGLTAASGSPNALCIDTTSSEVLENTGATCTVSSKRFKHDIQPLESVDIKELIRALDPKEYKLNKTDEDRFGLIAEEVYAIEPRLVNLDEEGIPYSVRYEELTVVLLKSLQQLYDVDEDLAKQTKSDGNGEWAGLVGLAGLIPLLRKKKE